MNLINHLRQYFLRRKFRDKANIYRTARINNNVLFEGHNSLMSNVVVVNSYIGEGTIINDDSKISNCRIGRYCSIGDNVYTVLGQHPTRGFTSTHPAFYYDTTSQLNYTFHKGKALFDCKKMPAGESKYNVVIGNDVWIGSHAIILGGGDHWRRRYYRCRSCCYKRCRALFYSRWRAGQGYQISFP